MVLLRLGRDLGADRALDALTPAELRAWLLTLRETLSPISVAGYVRGLKAFGHWYRAEELAEAASLRTLRRPRVPHKLVEPPQRGPPGAAALPTAGEHRRHRRRSLSRARRRPARRAGSPAGLQPPKATRGNPGALQPAPAAAHLRALLSGQRRRRLQPAAHPRPRHARHGEALRGSRRYGSGRPSPHGISRRSPSGQEERRPRNR